MYKLYCRDSSVTEPLEWSDISLILTDAPNENTLSTKEVENIIRKYRLMSGKFPYIAICKDEDLNSFELSYQFPHSAFGGNFMEKVKFARNIIIKLTKPFDVVLDPFCGYSATGFAAMLESRRYIGIDNKPEAIKESEKRLTN